MTAIPHPDELGAARVHDGHAHHGEHAHEHHEIDFVRKYVFSTDHKVIGLQFLLLGLIFFVVGGLYAMLVRWQLGWPDQPVPLLGHYMKAQGYWSGEGMPPTFYNAAFTMHATIMIFFVIIPLLVGTFGNYLIPLMIGAKDMAFPFMNGLAFWTALPAGTIMVSSFFLSGGPAQAGWTSYPPLSALWVGGTAPGTAWPLLSVVMNFVALYLCLMFICAYYVRLVPRDAVAVLDNEGLIRAAGAVLLAIGALSILLPFFGFDWKILHWAGKWTIVGALILTAVGIGLVCRSINAAVSGVISVPAALVLNWVLQKAAFDGQSCWFLSIFLLGFSSILGAVNYLSTIVKLRCPGMTMFRMPLSVWALFITSILVLLATPVLASVLFMNLLDHHRITSFFLPQAWYPNKVEGHSGGGFPLLHQHLFWFYSHPAVYIMILPAMGFVSDIISTFARKPIFGYRPMVYAIAGIAFLGFIVWAHHMFQSGMNPTLGTTFAISTMFIAVPSAIKTFNWLGTLWGGNIRFTAAMWNAISFVAMFVIGGLSGVFMASTAVDVHIHDTYFIVAHIHYVLFGGTMFGVFGSLYYWYPKMFGRMMNETLGKIHFVLTFIFFNGTFFTMHILGITGFPRRIANYLDYATYHQYQGMNQLISVCAFGLGLSQIPFVINFIGSWFWGPRAPRNPWHANSLEWETPSPPPHGNFEGTPVVYRGPYEYSSPLVAEDWLAQSRYVEGAQAAMASTGH
jgi:heme/copper-type cytochrome/quinol oxidase subunit 1